MSKHKAIQIFQKWAAGDYEDYEQYYQDAMDVAKNEYKTKVLKLKADWKKQKMTDGKSALDAKVSYSSAVRKQEQDQQLTALKEQQRAAIEQKKQQEQAMKEQQEAVQLPYPSIGGVQSQGTNPLAAQNSLAAQKVACEMFRLARGMSEGTHCKKK